MDKIARQVKKDTEILNTLISIKAEIRKRQRQYSPNKKSSHLATLKQAEITINSVIDQVKNALHEDTKDLVFVVARQEPRMATTRRLQTRKTATSESNIRVYDNGGRTADRYTVIINDACWYMSSDADAPNGVCKHIGWGKHRPEGTRIPVSAAPAGVKRQIENIQESTTRPRFWEKPGMV